MEFLMSPMKSNGEIENGIICSQNPLNINERIDFFDKNEEVMYYEVIPINYIGRGRGKYEVRDGYVYECTVKDIFEE